MCSTFTSDCGYEESTFILIGDVHCPNTKCSGKLLPAQKDFLICRQKRLSMSAMGVCVPGAQYFLKYQTNSFFCHLVKGFTFLKRVQS